MKQRVYIDTSVIGGCEDPEFARWSELLFDEFRSGLKIAVVSDVTRRELEGAPEEVKQILSDLPVLSVESVFLTEEAEQLAQAYIENGVVSGSISSTRSTWRLPRWSEWTCWRVGTFSKL